MPVNEYDEVDKPLYSEEQVREIQKFNKINKNDYYAILTVERDADDLSVKKAYRKVGKYLFTQIACIKVSSRQEPSSWCG